MEANMTTQSLQPNEYSQSEQKILRDTQKKAASMTGWFPTKTPIIAHEFLMRLWANTVDFWNPLFNDKEYAKDTKFGNIIAAPFFIENIDNVVLRENLDLEIDPNIELNGVWHGRNDGGDAEMLQPIFPNDSFKVRIVSPSITDTTVPGSSIRSFLLTTTIEYVNQKGEVAYRMTSYLTNEINYSSDGRIQAPPQFFYDKDIYKYGPDDWKLIHKIESQEKITGSEPCKWSDVNVGDMPRWVIVGPTTTIDMIKFGGLAMMQDPPMREQLKTIDKEQGMDHNGIYHIMAEGHYSNEGIPGRIPIHYMAFGRSLMARLVTNFIGDNGWMTRFSWRNETLANEYLCNVDILKGKKVSGRGKYGDTIIAKGIIKDKYIQGEDHLVDIVTWCENLQGEITQAGIATALLE